ncbi:MAG TPA: phosphatase PAP2 family protein [Micavibrio sp.]
MRHPLLTRPDIVFLLLVALYMGLSAVTAHQYGLSARLHFFMYMNHATNMTGLLALCYFFYEAFKIIYVLMVVRPARPSKYIWAEWRKGMLDSERLLRALPYFIGFVFFFSTFSSMKQMIPGINPFQWDETFAALDKTLHFGVDPWRILYAPFQWPFMQTAYSLITYAINMNYNLWLVSVFAILYWQLFSKSQPRIRFQFFIAFILAWAVNGTLLATLLSSAGPCFLERLTGSGYYAPLMAQLNAAHQDFPIFAITTQDALWRAASAHENMVGGGISAMPSIHVASALLFWLLARARQNKYASLFGVFFFLIMVGSVYLGWHYAVDGYLAIITTYGIWHLSGILAKRLVTLPQQALVNDTAETV